MRVAAVLGPVSGPFVLQGISFLCGGGSGAGELELLLDWKGGDAMPSGPPAPPLARKVVAVREGSSQALTEVDLRADRITLNGGWLFVVLVHRHGGLPAVGYDTDGATAGRNYFSPSATDGLTENRGSGFPGDWIVRARIEPQPSAPRKVLTVPALRSLPATR
jgi:hypothetical protein